jgi:LPS sulfotransferase NodH
MKYLICVTNRVGSSWFCSMLASTGLAGDPVEHCNLPPGNWPHFREHYQAILKNDPLGIKTSYNGLMRAIEHVGIDEFRDTPSIWLRRRDTLAQAISNYRAMESGQWFARRGETVAPVTSPPDKDVILAFQAEYEKTNNVLWPAWFASMGIEPLHIWYEEMCQAPVETVRAVCRFLGLADPPRIDTGLFQIQRDEVSEQWRSAVGAGWKPTFSADGIGSR